MGGGSLHQSLKSQQSAEARDQGHERLEPPDLDRAIRVEDADDQTMKAGDE